MAAEPLSKQELAILHERIARAAAELRRRTRRPAGLRVPDDLVRVAEVALRGLHPTPRLIASIAAAILVAAGVAAVLAVRGRRI